MDFSLGFLFGGVVVFLAGVFAKWRTMMAAGAVTALIPIGVFIATNLNMNFDLDKPTVWIFAGIVAIIALIVYGKG